MTMNNERMRETQNGTLCCSVHDYRTIQSWLAKPTLRFIVEIQGVDPRIVST